MTNHLEIGIVVAMLSIATSAAQQPKPKPADKRTTDAERKASVGQPISTSIVSETGDATLWFRCQRQQAEVSINWPTVLNAKTKQVIMLVIVGDSTPEKQLWFLSTPTTIALRPSDSVALIHRLLKSRRFGARIEPNPGAARTALFDVRGLIKAITPLAKACPRIKSN